MDTMKSTRGKWLRDHGLEGGDFSQVHQRVGTDCSGMETPVIALQNLGLQHTHLNLGLLSHQRVDGSLELVVNRSPQRVLICC